MKEPDWQQFFPPVRRFGGGGDREKLRTHVRELLQEWVERFSGLGGFEL